MTIPINDDAFVGRAGAETMPNLDQASGGDPVCWLDKVCPSCGLFTGERPSATCPRCGEDLQAT